VDTVTAVGYYRLRLLGLDAGLRYEETLKIPKPELPVITEVEDPAVEGYSAAGFFHTRRGDGIASRSARSSTRIRMPSAIALSTDTPSAVRHAPKRSGADNNSSITAK